MPAVRYIGRKEVRDWNLQSIKSFRWTQSCPRTGGVLLRSQASIAKKIVLRKDFLCAFATLREKFIFRRLALHEPDRTPAK
jgi:hypothetical protein